MNKTCLIHIKPGQIADRKFLLEATVKLPTVFGFSMQYEGKLISENHPKGWSVDDIETIVGDANKEGHRVLMLGNWPEYKHAEDIQPYVLADESGDPILSMFYEGDFSNWSGMDGDHTSEYCVSDAVIFPAIQKAYEDAGKDYEEFVKLLRGQKLQQTLKNSYKDRGFFLFLPKTGEPIIFGKNQAGDEYSWGSASNVEGLTYKEKEATPEPVKESAPVSFLDRMRGKTTATASPPPAPDVKNVITQPKTETKIPEKPKGEVVHVNLVEVKCPKHLEKGVKNHWLRLFNAKVPGELPENHLAKDVSVWVHPDMVEFAKRDVKNTKDMRLLVSDIKEAKAGKAEPKSVNADKPPITMPKSASTVREPASNYVNTSTVLSAAEKEQQVNMLAGFLAMKHSPLEIQKMEAQLPTYSSETGTTFEERLFMSKDEYMKLVGGNKVALAIILEFRAKYIQASGVKLEDLVSGAKGEEPKAVNTEKVNDQPVKPAASTTSTGGGLSFLRKAS